MSAFIDQAKEVLTPEQVTKLELLARKSADFDTSNDEDNELFELKKEVKRLVATRDRQKNLNFLKDGEYPLEDILEVMGTSKKQIVKESGFTLAEILATLGTTKKEVVAAVNKAFPKEATTPAFEGVLATYGTEDVALGKRITKVLGKTIAEGGEKKFVENLTETGKAWLSTSYVSEKGPFKGQTIFGNLNMIANKFKFNKDSLKQELGLVAKKEEASKKKTTKKEEEKVA